MQMMFTAGAARRILFVLSSIKEDCDHGSKDGLFAECKMERISSLKTEVMIAADVSPQRY